LNDGNVACLFCHDPHGGKDRFFLKEQGRNPSSG
jgi:predicted CXXCH cytochrome family protein